MYRHQCIYYVRSNVTLLLVDYALRKIPEDTFTKAVRKTMLRGPSDLLRHFVVVLAACWPEL